MKRWLLSLLIVGAMAGGATAQDNSIGFGAGFVDPEVVDGTLWFTGNVRLKVANRLVLEPEVGYWSKSEKLPGIAEASIKDLNAGVNVLYVPTTSGSVEFAIGAGVGAHFLKGEVGVLDVFNESETETKLGIHLLASLGYKVTGGFGVFASVRYDLVSDINQFKVYAGVRFKI